MSWMCQHSFFRPGRKSQAGIGLALSAFSVILLLCTPCWDGQSFFAVIPKILGKTGQGNSILELPMKLITWENATKST